MHTYNAVNLNATRNLGFPGMPAHWFTGKSTYWFAMYGCDEGNGLLPHVCLGRAYNHLP